MNARPDNVTYLPVWKDGATAEERLFELAMVARKHPERFARMIVVYQEDLPLGDGDEYPSTLTRQISTGMSNTQVLGMLEIAKQEVLNWMYGK